MNTTASIIENVEITAFLCHTTVKVQLAKQPEISIKLMRGGLVGGDNGVYIKTDVPFEGEMFTVARWFGGQYDSDGLGEGWWAWADADTRVRSHNGDLSMLAYETAQAYAESVIVPRLHAVYAEVMTPEIARDARITALRCLTPDLRGKAKREEENARWNAEQADKWERELAELIA